MGWNCLLIHPTTDVGQLDQGATGGLSELPRGFDDRCSTRGSKQRLQQSCLRAGDRGHCKISRVAASKVAPTGKQGGLASALLCARPLGQQCELRKLCSRFGQAQLAPRGWRQSGPGGAGRSCLLTHPTAGAGQLGHQGPKRKGDRVGRDEVSLGGS